MRKTQSGSAFDSMIRGLSYYYTPLVCIPGVIEVLDVCQRPHNKNKRLKKKFSCITKTRDWKKKSAQKERKKYYRNMPVIEIWCHFPGDQTPNPLLFLILLLRRLTCTLSWLNVLLRVFEIAVSQGVREFCTHRYQICSQSHYLCPSTVSSGPSTPPAKFSPPSHLRRYSANTTVVMDGSGPHDPCNVYLPSWHQRARTLRDHAESTSCNLKNGGDGQRGQNTCKTHARLPRLQIGWLLQGTIGGRSFVYRDIDCDKSLWQRSRGG